MKIKSILKDLQEMRRINENLNIEILNIKNEKNSNLDISSDENKKLNANNGLNNNNILEKQLIKQNSNVLNVRQIFEKCNTLKNRFSQKGFLNNYSLQKSSKINTPNHSVGSGNSNISARIVENKQKFSCCELNGVSKSHIPIPPKNISNLKRSNFYLKFYLENFN